jgi:DNA repair photolyase
MSQGDLGKKAFKGRAALSNPTGRFERTGVEAFDDGWYVEEGPESVATTLEPDRAKSVISTNDSPDIGFDQSINPYRGCEHGCIYCIRGDTPILMADGTTRPIADVRIGDAIYGTVREGFYRRYVKTRVLAHWSVIKPAYRITLKDGTVLVAGGDHRFLTERGWKFVTGTERGAARRPHLTTANKLMGTGAFAEPLEKDVGFRRGYLCGLIRGDGLLGQYSYFRVGRGESVQHQFRLALCDSEALQRAQHWLKLDTVETESSVFSVASANRRPMQAICTHARWKVDRIRGLIAWRDSPSRSWRAGFLAGIYDAGGSYGNGILRISNTDPEIIRRITESLQAFDFKFTVEHIHREVNKPIDVVRLLGGLQEHLRFFHRFDPAIRRKCDISGQAVKSSAELGVASIEPLGGALRLYDITTGTEDFIANGVISHNCYARPSHSYMGLSPGRDFETRLFYKADVAKVLEAELAKPNYVCKPIMLGANTDPYQPAERRMLVTRAILETLARCRHPVSIVTKGALVVRDIDILSDMARDNLVRVTVSVTSLDPEMKRTLEPRAASPQARLRAIAELSKAGIRVGSLVAPIIPALTDHEMERIMEAVVEAGALWVGYVMVRLPYEVKDLFREWLTEHHPQRAAHVMALIQDMRGGRDNDPNFGSRMRGTGPVAALIRNRFKITERRLGLDVGKRLELNTALFRRPGPAGAQLTLGF